LLLPGAAHIGQLPLSRLAERAASRAAENNLPRFLLAAPVIFLATVRFLLFGVSNFQRVIQPLDQAAIVVLSRFNSGQHFLFAAPTVSSP